MKKSYVIWGTILAFASFIFGARWSYSEYSDFKANEWKWKEWEIRRDFFDKMSNLSEIPSALHVVPFVMFSIEGCLDCKDQLKRDLVDLAEKKGLRSSNDKDSVLLSINVKQEKEVVVVTYEEIRPVWVAHKGEFRKVRLSIYNIGWQEPKNITNDEIIEHVKDFVSARIDFFKKCHEQTRSWDEMYNKHNRLSSYDGEIL